MLAMIPKRRDALMSVYDGGIEGDLIGQFDGSHYTVMWVPMLDRFLVEWNGATDGPAATQKIWVDSVEWLD